MMSNWILNGVTKKFEDTTAINNISLEIEENKIYGLIGRNGAGKTTLLKLLANQLQPTEGIIQKGNVSIRGNDELTRSICLARDSINIKGVAAFTVDKILKFASYIYPNWDNDYCEELINKFDLNPDKKYIKLSKGMHTVVGIVIGLASRASLTMFDEPYIGLDPVFRELFYELLIADYEQYKRTIIISSHLINEFENLFERVLIIDRGRVLLNEELEEIRKKARLISGEKSVVEEILKGKNILYKQVIGKLANYTVLDDFTEKELYEYKNRNIKWSSLDLQRLFVNLSKGGHISEQQ
ncbi:ABC transporter ATP-binding protein [Halothermothrix orenii]|uniref:ABC transporter related n=1 Tax=Halothermothrix orenii (strain H 168 / OCM 544 / DSM 9562) TaxID=373903 RepID=B8D1Y3_HALOH|nr:ABC transporter ATP-binding protein [Halothermothrix orenii]ACL69210.1 ABC transporter related [Halothermothrix orenii H 168]